MFKRARYFRWAILLVSIFIEMLAFWYGGPQSTANAPLSQAILTKMRDPMSWAWVGWASLTMAWIWAEFAFAFFSYGRRTRALLRRNDHEELVFETGAHWLVLLRDIRLNQLNDGVKEKLEASLFPADAKRSFAWHAVWLPVFLAAATMMYFIGWAAWSVRNVPASVETWSAALRGGADHIFTGPFAFAAAPVEAALIFLLHGLEAFYAAARDNSLPALGAIAALWLALRLCARLTGKAPLLPQLFRAGARLSVLAGVFAVLSTEQFDWLSPVYALSPHHGVIAMGFFPLTLASAFYFPHILFWSSWRYAIIRDSETHDATLLTLGGVFNSLQHRINLQRIVDTDIFQPWWQRILDIGDIELKEMGGGEAEIVHHISGPNRLLDEIRNAIRQARKRSGQKSEFDASAVTA